MLTSARVIGPCQPVDLTCLDGTYNKIPAPPKESILGTCTDCNREIWLSPTITALTDGLAVVVPVCWLCALDEPMQEALCMLQTS